MQKNIGSTLSRNWYLIIIYALGIGTKNAEKMEKNPKKRYLWDLNPTKTLGNKHSYKFHTWKIYESSPKFMYETY